VVRRHQLGPEQLHAPGADQAGLEVPFDRLAGRLARSEQRDYGPNQALQLTAAASRLS
jgi:hypothetical protein